MSTFVAIGLLETECHKDTGTTKDGPTDLLSTGGQLELSTHTFMDEGAIKHHEDGTTTTVFKTSGLDEFNLATPITHETTEDPDIRLLDGQAPLATQMAIAERELDLV